MDKKPIYTDVPEGWLRGRRDKYGNVKKMMKKILPILSWLPQYNVDSAVSDLIAGVTVGLTVIPQGIAYAVVAGLPPQYGLYSAFMGCFVYALFGSAKDITIGPTAIMSLMTNTYAKYGPEYVILLSFLSGFIIFVFGLLKLGFLIDFISVPVIAGFTSAAALTIASGQVKSLLGITLDQNRRSHTHAGVIDYYIDIVYNWATIRWQDATLGIVCSILLLSLRAINRTRWFKPVSSNPPNTSPGLIQRTTNKLPPSILTILDKTVWFICTARNAIIVIVCLGIAALIDPNLHDCSDNPDLCVFKLTGSIQSGLPSFRVPPFSVSFTPSIMSNITSNLTDNIVSPLVSNITNHNTATQHLEIEDNVSFVGMISKLGSAIIIIPIIAILESVAIAKSFAKGKPVDASQEMVALGLCNIVGSFVQAMPTTGSFSRTAVNCASGATLASVIMTAVIFSVEHQVLRPMWSSKKIDLFPGFICLLVGLFYELEMGIFSGTGVHIAILLYHTARPKVTISLEQVPGTSQHYLVVTPASSLVFPSVSHVRKMVSKAGIQQGSSKLPVVVDCSHVGQVDFTAAEGFKAMVDDFNSRGQEIYWTNTNKGVYKTLRTITGDSLKTISGPIELRIQYNRQV